MVDVGGIEEGNAGLDGGVHDLMGNRFVGLMTERRGAEAQSRDGKAGGPECRVLHVALLVWRFTAGSD
jgi:hypothetical protein